MSADAAVLELADNNFLFTKKCKATVLFINLLKVIYQWY
jgi:hypothetical protein